MIYTWLPAPLLFAIYPILALLAHNIEEVAFSEALRPLFISLIGAMILLLTFRLILRDWEKASLISTFMLIVFYSYGHIYTVAKTWQVGPYLLGRHSLLIPISLLVLIVWIWWVVKRVVNPTKLFLLFNVIGTVSLVLPLYSIIRHTTDVSYDSSRNTEVVETQDFEVGRLEGQSLPDIYYIIVDGYARQDVLHELYGFDNDAFINSLRSRGFYVADQSRSNYSQTMLSLASSLNMAYIDDLVEDLDPVSDNRSRLAELFDHSRVRTFLESKGYSVIAFETGYGQTHISGADRFYTTESLLYGDTGRWPLLGSITPFEGILLQSTVARVLFDVNLIAEKIQSQLLFDTNYQEQRDRIIFTLDTLQEIPSFDGHHFVFAHLISPHPPFVFGSNGEMVIQSHPYSIQDADRFSGTREEYIQGYSDQLTYLNQLLIETIDDIFAKSEIEPIILLQADHGPGAYMVWESPEDTNFKERLSILNAYFLPNGGNEALYPSITPVNSFSYIFNTYFETSYELLKDESFHSTWSRPFDFIPYVERNGTD